MSCYHLWQMQANSRQESSQRISRKTRKNLKHSPPTTAPSHLVSWSNVHIAELDLTVIWSLAHSGRKATGDYRTFGVNVRQKFYLKIPQRPSLRPHSCICFIPAIPWTVHQPCRYKYWLTEWLSLLNEACIKKNWSEKKGHIDKIQK